MIDPAAAVGILQGLIEDVPDVISQFCFQAGGIAGIHQNGLTQHVHIGFIILIQLNNAVYGIVKGRIIRYVDEGLPVEDIRSGAASIVNRNGVRIERVCDFLSDKSKVVGAFKAKGKLAFSLKRHLAFIMEIHCLTVRHVVQIGAGRFHTFIFA